MKAMVKYFLSIGLVFPLLVQGQSPEPHLTNLKQLTFGGDNTEAYFSPDGLKLSFQSNNPLWELKCDQIYYMIINEAEDNLTYQPVQVSNGEGRTTCSYYMPDGKKILYSSSFKTGKECPPEPIQTGKFLWAIYPDFDIFISDEKGKVGKQLTNTVGYDAQATVSPKGDRIVFTSTRNGDLDLYLMDIDGKNVKQLTFGIGYKGNASFSPDGSHVIFCASYPKGKDTIEYKKSLTEGSVTSDSLELYRINIDGTGLSQITKLGRSNRAPAYHPSGKKIIFSSNHHSDQGYEFQLFTINIDGTGLERISTESLYNAFPVFSPDGKRLVFSSSRYSGDTRETNLFIADWVE